MSTLSKEAIEAATGRELDALVAEHVFDWEDVEQAHPRAEWMGYGHTTRPGLSLLPVPAYSTDGNAMLAVKTAMHERGFASTSHGNTPGFQCRLYNLHTKGFGDAICENECVAVCRAALLAILATRPTP